MDKQPALNADEVLMIVSHFDRLDAADAEAALRAAAELAGCPVGVRWSDATEPTVWLEREGPARATDELLLHRLRHLLNRAAPAQGTTSLRIDDPALIELLLSGDAKPEERARAARLLGLDATTNEPSSNSAKMRSRAVSLPLAWILSTAASPTGCSASSLRRRRSASLPAVVCMSGWGAAASAAVWLSDSVVVMGPDAIARHPAEHAWALESSQKFSRRDVRRSR
ncbi:Uncharacterised protein [Mycobacteroides abscessus]|nr:Uncharacterised protein [Mycobacteroides abscessus]